MFVEKPRWNIYTALLVVSFVALVIGSICLGAEMKAYDWDMNARGAKAPG